MSFARRGAPHEWLLRENTAQIVTARLKTVALMRAALVEAKVGVSHIRTALETTQAQLKRERNELETVQRRGRLAIEIGDAETARVAAQFERRYAERVAVLEQKASAQEAELMLADREVEEMTAQLRAMAGGADVSSPPPSVEEESPNPDALRREVDRAARESAAERQLDELKRRIRRREQ